MQTVQVKDLAGCEGQSFPTSYMHKWKCLCL